MKENSTSTNDNSKNYTELKQFATGIQELFEQYGIYISDDITLGKSIDGHFAITGLVLETNKNNMAVKEKVGKKDDYKDDKPMWHLLDLNMLEGVVRLLMFGLEKYGVRDSWKYLEDGEDRWYSACIRHLNAHQGGEELDSESKQMHLDAAILNLLFLRYHYLKNKKNE